MSSHTYKDLDAALRREDALKVELALAISREWVFHKAPQLMDKIAALDKEVTDLRAQMVGLRVAVEKLLNEQRPKE